MHAALLIVGVLGVAATLPMLLELALVQSGILLRAFRQKEPLEKPSEEPNLRGTFFIIVPAHDEELLIQRTVHSLVAAADSDTAILVVAHNCCDSTAPLARDAGAQVLELREDSGRGKGAALHAGFAHAIAAGAVAVGVVDADSVASPTLISALRTALVNAPAAQCRYELQDGPEISPSANLQALAFRAINTVRARGRSALGLSAGIFGNGFALRTSLLEQVPYSAFSIAEDLEYHIALVRHGQQVAYTESALMMAAGATGKAAVGQRSRWEGGRLRVARENWLGMSGSILRGQIRLMEPLLDLLTLPLALGVFLLMVLCFIPERPLQFYAGIGLLIVALHAITAALASESPRSALNLLLRVPFYILWKVALVPRILTKSRRDAAWERSARAAAPVSDSTRL